MKYNVVKTNNYPCEWYGGPIYDGEPYTNASCYYWKTKKEAKEYCKMMNRLIEKTKELQRIY